MTTLMLPQIAIDDMVAVALREDLGRGGDITSQSLIPENQPWKAQLVARQDGVVAGLAFAASAFRQMDPEIHFTPANKDGSIIVAGDVLAYVSGLAVPMLAAERTALNFMSHLCGIATLTHQYVKAVEPYDTKICCTRKTTPGLRIAEKYAIRAGGGRNHRFGLDDAVLIKDNHIAVVGDIREAINRARASVGHMVKIEVEVDSIEQLKTILDMSIDAVLLDNMAPVVMAQAVQLIAGKFVTEASGGVCLKTVHDVASTGVDMISVGALTHSAPHVDLALDNA